MLMSINYLEYLFKNYRTSPLSMETPLPVCPLTFTYAPQSAIHVYHFFLVIVFDVVLCMVIKEEITVQQFILHRRMLRHVTVVAS